MTTLCGLKKNFYPMVYVIAWGFWVMVAYPSFPAMGADSGGDRFLPAEEMPPKQTGRLLTITELRYCLFQEKRLREVKPDPERTIEVDAFNELVSDFNDRCSIINYYKWDMTQAQSELTSFREILGEQGRGLLHLYVRAAGRSREAQGSAGALVGPIESGLKLPPLAPPSQAPSSPTESVAASSATPIRTTTESPKPVGPAGGDGRTQEASAAVERSPVEADVPAAPVSAPASSVTGAPSWRPRPLEATALEPAVAQPSPTSRNGESPALSGGKVDAALEIPGKVRLDPARPNDVREIQRRLADLGFFKAEINGLWGPKTRVALKTFKVSENLADDEVWDAAAETHLLARGGRSRSTNTQPATTFPASSAAGPPGSSSSLAGGGRLDISHAEDVRLIQQKLTELGLFKAEINGLWGPKTRNALRAFKAANGLPDNEVWDAETEARLKPAPGPLMR